MDSFFAGLLLALSTNGSVMPASGSGSVSRLEGDYNSVSWSVGGFGVAGMQGTAVGPYRCTTTCTVNFAQTVTRLFPAIVNGYHVAPRFVFAGPEVTETAVQTCRGCEPRGLTWVTTWKPVPITLSATVVFTNLFDASDVTIVELVGKGTAHAYSYWLAVPGPWNYGTIQWDFTYDVVPEPSTALLTAFSVLGVAGVLRRRRRV